MGVIGTEIIDRKGESFRYTAQEDSFHGLYCCQIHLASLASSLVGISMPVRPWLDLAHAGLCTLAIDRYPSKHNPLTLNSFHMLGPPESSTATDTLN